MSFERDLSDANSDFAKFAPALLSRIKGQLIYLETDPGPLPQMFDKYSGIDAIQVVDNNMRGIALRVQWGRDYRTFSIRYKRKSGAKTEYEKRRNAIFGGKGYLYPYLTIQAYLDKRGAAKRLLSCCVVRTMDLYQYIEDNIVCLERTKKVAPDGNEFLVVGFDELATAGFTTIIFSSDQLQQAA